MTKVLLYRKYGVHFIVVIVFTFIALYIVDYLRKDHPAFSEKQTVCVPIMMYHQVKNREFGKDVISPYEFESDLKFLAEHDYHTITMTQLIDYVYDEKTLPDNPIILTFDDGYLNTYKYVFPLLKKYQMKIVLSIVGKCTDDFSRVVDNNVNYAHMTWNQVIEMEEAQAAEIQNHSYNLHKICNGRYGCGQMRNESIPTYEQCLTEDINMLQKKIYHATKHMPNTFTYPYGKFNDNTDAIIKKLGFRATLTVGYGVNLVSCGRPQDLFNLKRICRAHNHGIEKLIREGMETLKYMDDERAKSQMLR
jgi:peptidoglycan/xylan/chitin deacetylase (PgdA/CDA1 family)